MEHNRLKRLGYQAGLSALIGLYIFLCMLPLSGTVGRFPGPDLLVALLIAWLVRRPDYVPALLAGALIFLADMLFQRPPGLHAGLTLLGLEYLRARSQSWRDMGFGVEWFWVGFTLVAILTAERAVLSLFMVEQVSMGRAILQVLATIAVYPLVVMVSALVFGVRRVLPGEAEGLKVRAT